MFKIGVSILKIHIYESVDQVGQVAATLIAAQVTVKPDSVLGLATGSTPIATYKNLIKQYHDGILDFSKITTFNLDEYCGLPKEHPCSYYTFMQEELFSHINIKPENTHIPDGNAEDLQKEATNYDSAIEDAGGIDLQILGIGRNGHIGFNEPGDTFTQCCHTVKLTQSTLDANRRFFNSDDEVPKEAISLGIRNIMNARTVLLMATGKEKADAIYKTIHGLLDPNVPASMLSIHANVIFLLDKAAASKL